MARGMGFRSWLRSFRRLLNVGQHAGTKVVGDAAVDFIFRTILLPFAIPGMLRWLKRELRLGKRRRARFRTQGGKGTLHTQTASSPKTSKNASTGSKNASTGAKNTRASATNEKNEKNLHDTVKNTSKTPKNASTYQKYAHTEAKNDAPYGEADRARSADVTEPPALEAASIRINIHSPRDAHREEADPSPTVSGKPRGETTIAQSRPRDERDRFVSGRMMLTENELFVPYKTVDFDLGDQFELAVDARDKGTVYLLRDGCRVGRLPQESAAPFATALRLGRQFYGVVVAVGKTVEYEIWNTAGRGSSSHGTTG